MNPSLLDPGTWGEFGLFFVGFVLAFGVLPVLVLPQPRGSRSLLDAYAINLVRWFALIIALSHLLVAVGIYGRFSMGIALLAIAGFGKYRHRTDALSGLIFGSGDGRGKRSPKPRGSLTDRVRIWLVASPILAVLLGSFLLRAVNAFESVRLHPPDAYIHMAWAQSFVDNNLWPDGIYPPGLPALIAFVDRLTPFTDIVNVARFMGPLTGTFLVAAIYYTVVRLTRQPAAALIAAGSIGLFGALPQWRVVWHRQSGLLPQEFALAIALLALVFTVLAVTESRRERLVALWTSGRLTVDANSLWVAIAAFAVSMMHPISTLAMAVMIAMAGLGATVVSGRWRDLVVTGVLSGIGAGLGQLAQLVGQLFGYEMYSGWSEEGGFASLFVDIDRAARLVELQERWGEDLAYLGHNELSVAAAVALVPAVVGIVVLVKRGARDQAAQLAGLVAAVGVMVLLHDLTLLMYQIQDLFLVRFAGVIGQLLPLAFGAGAAALMVLLVRRATLNRIAATLVVGVAVLGGSVWGAPLLLQEEGQQVHFHREGSSTEYEAAAQVTMDLKGNLSRGSYTVVGTTTQRQLLAGHGSFIEAWVFARDAPSVDPSAILPVPARHVFVYVEMDPYPTVELPPVGATEEYYLDREKRGRIQATLYRWAETRRQQNPDTTIYVDEGELRVYLISRDAMVPAVDDPTLFREYTWRPGELFNEGPTSPRQIQPELESSPTGSTS